MSLLNPSTWSWVDNIQNKVGQTKSAASSYKGNVGGKPKFSNPKGTQLNDTFSGFSVPQINPYLNGNVGTWGTGSQLDATGSGTGAAAVDPYAGLRQDATNRIHSILSAYDSLFGGIDTSARDQTDKLNTSYDTQTQNLNKAFEAGQGQTGSAYAARGLGQSSFLGDALGQNADIYNQNNTELTNSRNNSLADLGRYVATNKAQLNAGKNSYNDMLGQVGNYDGNSLQSLIPSLQQAYGNLQQQQAGLGTDSSFIQGLNAITPVQNHGVDQLGAKLQSLVQSGTPQFAKNQLANGLIKQTGLTDPAQQSYWQNYYQQLIGG